MKTIEQALKEGNSAKNQDIKDRFVLQHVYANVNQLVEYCLAKSYEDSESPISHEEIENYWTLPEYHGEFAAFDGGTEEARNEEIERLRDLQSDLYDEMQENPENEEEIEAKRSKIEEEICELEELESEPEEVYEWWMVSEYLCEKLADLGHPVIAYQNIWGRCTTGQAILLDYSITRICAEMEILEGQANSWA